MLYNMYILYIYYMYIYQLHLYIVLKRIITLHMCNIVFQNLCNL
jgi:hypothetical protein